MSQLREDCFELWQSLIWFRLTTAIVFVGTCMLTISLPGWAQNRRLQAIEQQTSDQISALLAENKQLTSEQLRLLQAAIESMNSQQRRLYNELVSTLAGSTQTKSDKR